MINYEQKYNDLVKRLREYRERFGNPLYKEIGEEFPELAESEDEKIRKHIVTFLLEADKMGDAPEEVAKWLAYLEKQKEQKLNIELIQRSWYMEGYTDGEFKREPMWNLVTGKGGPKYEKNEKYGHPKEQKPAEWGEEDEKIMEDIILAIREVWQKKDANRMIAKLKSLRPQPQGIYQQTVNTIRNKIADYESRQPLTADRMQDLIDNIRVKCKDAVECAEILNDEPHWKPSEEQMAALAAAKIGVDTDYELLESLYEQLKAL